LLIRKPDSIPSSEITPESTYVSRRRFVRDLSIGSVGLAASSIARANTVPLDEPLTPERIITSYNNFYEFGTDKGDPVRHAHQLTTAPWKVKVSGEVAKPGEYDYEDLIKGLTPEERIYRFRCVEAWSMVVPWTGIPLKALLQRLEPTGNAKYVEFTTLVRPSEMPGQRSLFTSIDWPYVEGLRLDEAYHPLSIMVVGLYGKLLPKQNRSVEVRLQEHQEHRADSLHRKETQKYLEYPRTSRIRLLRQREPEGVAPTVESGERTAVAYDSVQSEQNSDSGIQWIRRGGGIAVRRDEPPAQFLARPSQS